MASHRVRRDRLGAAGRAAFPGFRLRALARTTSTQDVVRAAARGGAEEGYTCIAAEQTAGRGRHGRVWVAPPGTALLTSVLLRPQEGPTGVTVAAGLAVADAIEAAGGLSARLKWPNDVLAGRRKLAGILAEVEPLAPGRPIAVVLGVGVNLTVDDFPDFGEAPAGVSLHRLVAPAPPPHPEDLLAALLTALAARLRRLADGGVPALRDDWRRRAEGLGEPVVAVTPGGRVEGVAVDLADDGGLVLETAGGRVTVLAGDVLLGPAAGGANAP